MVSERKFHHEKDWEVPPDKGASQFFCGSFNGIIFAFVPGGSIRFFLVAGTAGLDSGYSEKESGEKLKNHRGTSFPIS